MAFQSVSGRGFRDFNMLKAGVLVALMGVALCVTWAQHDDDIVADDDDVHSMVIPASGSDCDGAAPVSALI